MTIKILVTKLKVNLQYFQDCKSLSILEIIYLLFLYYRLMKKIFKVLLCCNLIRIHSYICYKKTV
ncbi:unnamed protein product [Brassica oleracea]|uniref:(rape) hypothetical protein n=1 Tax=Brassica napus TaxID=3708 RepID=A0A816J573_BRANA|nr:unnamed protein product [Brassica napus]